MKGVYALKLEGEKFYVGSSTDVDSRIARHENGGGSEWTEKHEVNDIEVVIEASDEETRKMLEKSLTLDLMQQYGWQNVRGYAWCQCKLEYKPSAIA